MLRHPLRFVTFLAPNLFDVYAAIARSVGARLGMAVELTVGTSYRQLLTEIDVAFVCGLPYVKLCRRADRPLEPLAAPVLQGLRYGGRPIYFSDVIVRRDSPFRSFADLRGCTWAYNERYSQSGSGVVRYHLARLGETNGYFGRVVRAGWHQRAIRLVCAGKVDAAAIDAHVLAVARRDQPELDTRLRVLETLGPSTIQPVVAQRRLPAPLKAEVRAALLALGDDAGTRAALDRSLVERFVPIRDADYEDIRHMETVAAGMRLVCNSSKTFSRRGPSLRR